MIREDVANARRRDPAAGSAFEVWLTYSGLHAVWWYRVSHRLWGWRLRTLARVVSQVARFVNDIPRSVLTSSLALALLCWGQSPSATRA